MKMRRWEAFWEASVSVVSKLPFLGDLLSPALLWYELRDFWRNPWD